MGFRVQDLGTRFQDLGFRVWGLAFRVWGLAFRVWSLGVFGDWGSQGLISLGLGFRVKVGPNVAEYVLPILWSQIPSLIMVECASLRPQGYWGWWRVRRDVVSRLVRAIARVAIWVPGAISHLLSPPDPKPQSLQIVVSMKPFYVDN